MKNNDHIVEVLRRSLALVYGSDVASSFQENIAAARLQVPAPAVLSRSRLMLDVLLCRVKQAQWTNPKDYFIYLSMDSSPQNGLDYLMCLQDMVSHSSARQLMHCIDDEDLDLDEFLTSNFVSTTVLPLGIVASGNSGVAAKFECLFHSLKLECGPQAGSA